MSVRQVINVLADRGYLLYVCDPDPFCVGRFSQHVTRFYRCPPMGSSPAAYFSFVKELIEREQIDVLLPAHEQAYLFAGLREDLPSSVRLALTTFEEFSLVQNKVAFSQLLQQLGLPQPPTTNVTSKTELLQCSRFPVYVKAAFGTASRAVWLIRNAQELEDVASTLEHREAFADGILVQQVAAGMLERAQAIFNHGSLVQVHGYRQVMPGIGGGDAMKESVSRPLVAAHFELIGRKLNWHGPLSVDYIYDEGDGQPYYIDGNPRLVEPMNARLSGVDLVQAWLDLACNQPPQTNLTTRPGTRTHMALQVLLGHAQRRNDRLGLCRESWRLLRNASPYDKSVEELTPFKIDPLSCVIVIAVLVQLLVAPRRVANYLSAKSGAKHHLTRAVVQYVKQRRQELACGHEPTPLIPA
jgi:predicted ATP-grasp superfamily ATP-dependent carboligase